MNTDQRVTKLRESQAITRQRLNIVVAAMVIVEEFEVPQRRKRRWKVKPWASIRRRSLFGQYETLLHELRLENPADYEAYLRPKPELFQELYTTVGPRIRINQEWVLAV
ncbi:hypothetical protein DPMN_189808 [Dreissena polymorpha]|uniref:Uncharacterized protein n=1 Tax=Dreissena polymorpha TaxID=45954 RepID=A0A9D4DW69_DREPO|nr:hypothetical protein DPMN_189808 [Dreissena polymorpha]